MPIRFRPVALIAVCLAALGGVAIAGPVDQIHARIAGFKDMGNAFKQVNDGLRGGSLDPAVARSAGQRIGKVAKDQYSWFPVGSGPQPGVKTAAKPDIWAKPGEFRTAQDNFARQVVVFQKALGTNNTDLIRSETRKLGATCKQCHDNFRQSDD